VGLGGGCGYALACIAADAVDHTFGRGYLKGKLADYELNTSDMRAIRSWRRLPRSQEDKLCRNPRQFAHPKGNLLFRQHI